MPRRWLFSCSTIFLLGFGSTWWAMLMFGWLFGVILWSAFAVCGTRKHSRDSGEPFGTLILTFAITAIEVMMIAAVMLTGPAVSTLARDTMFAVIMIRVQTGWPDSHCFWRLALPRADLQTCRGQRIPGGNHSPRRAGADSAGFHLVSGSDAIGLHEIFLM